MARATHPPADNWCRRSALNRSGALGGGCRDRFAPTKDSDRNKAANCTQRGACSYGMARSARGKVVLVDAGPSKVVLTETNLHCERPHSAFDA